MNVAPALLIILAAMVAVAVFLDFRRGVYLMVLSLPVEAWIGSTYPWFFRVLGGIVVFAALLTVLLDPIFGKRLHELLSLTVTKRMLLLTAWVGVSAAWAISPSLSLGQTATMLNLVVFTVMVGLLSYKSLIRCVRLFIASAIVSVPVAVVLLPAVGPSTVSRLALPESNPNEYGLVLVMAAVASLWAFSGKARVGTLLILSFGVAATGSRTAVLAGLLTPLVMICVPGQGRRRTLATLGVYLLAITALLVMVREVPQLEALGRDRYAQTNLERIQTFQLRVSYWETARELFEDHPALGVGGGNFVIENERLSGQARVTHNMYVQTAVELGVIGLGLMVAVLWSLLGDGIRLGRRLSVVAGILAPLVTWLIFGLASSAFTLKPPYLFIGILLGLLATPESTNVIPVHEPHGSMLSRPRGMP